MNGIIKSTLTVIVFSLFTSMALAESPQACRYVSEGLVQQKWHKVRLLRGGEPLIGADHFSEAILMGRAFVDSCLPQVQNCRLASEGIVAGMWMKHRIQMDGEMVFGAEDMSTALRQLSELRQMGYCD